MVAVIGALDALITLDALLYALLYLFGLAFASIRWSNGAVRTRASAGHGPMSRARKSASKELRREQESQEKAEQDSDKK